MIKTLQFKKTEESIPLGVLTLISGDFSFYDRIDRHNLPSTEIILPFHDIYIRRVTKRKPQNFFCFNYNWETKFLIYPEAYFYASKSQKLFIDGCVKHIKNNRQIILYTESVYIFNELRIAIMKKMLDFKKIIVYFSQGGHMKNLEINGNYFQAPHIKSLCEWDFIVGNGK